MRKLALTAFCFFLLLSSLFSQDYGYIDKTGKIVLAPQFDHVYSFSEGIALVWENNLYGFIDKTGKVVIDFRFYHAESFSDGLALVRIKSYHSG